VAVKRASWLVIPLFVLASGVAQADTTVCIGASERGQELRSDGRLVAAKVNFLACADDTCPGAVKKDCAKALEELAPIIPSVVLAVREADGTDADPSKLKVSIDGVPEPDTLGGRAVQIDPGAHHLRIDTPRGPLKLDFVAREGELRRPLTLQLPAQHAPARPTEPAADTSAETRRHTAGPWVMFGLGTAAAVTGVVLILAGQPACVSNGNLLSCTERSDLVVGGALVLTAGALAIVGGLVWHFLEPTGPARKDIFWRVGPTGFGLAF